MDIVTLDFEEILTILIDGKAVQMMAFKTSEEGNVKFGIKAPRSIIINREEIYQKLKDKKPNMEIVSL